MLQLTLYAPDITCDHCIGTIRRTVDAHSGARFVSGDPESKRFLIEVDSGAVLDTLSAALSAEGYPLGEARPAAVAESSPVTSEGATTHPAYRITRTDAGADINYDCPCGCTAGFAYDRAVADQAPESCCCGRTMLVGGMATQRLQRHLDGVSAYALDTQTLTMPWGQPLEVALATPKEHTSEQGEAPEAGATDGPRHTT